MLRIDPCKGAGIVAHSWRNRSRGGMPWHLRWKPVCASTESVLSDWLRDKPFLENQPRAFIAARQTHGRGQRGKVWHSPEGGVWISAAIPWSKQNDSACLMGLAVAVALAERLENCSVPVKIKWPNDLLVDGRKLAGLLPSLIHRGGKIRLARIGLGLNVRNRVPLGGISLVEFLKPNHCKPFDWAAEVLLALDRAMELSAQPELIKVQSELRLWKDFVEEPLTGELWQVDGIDFTGALKLSLGSKSKTLTRWSQ